jgi:hypothetical protein
VGPRPSRTSHLQAEPQAPHATSRPLACATLATGVASLGDQSCARVGGSLWPNAAVSRVRELPDGHICMIAYTQNKQVTELASFIRMTWAFLAPRALGELWLNSRSSPCPASIFSLWIVAVRVFSLKTTDGRNRLKHSRLSMVTPMNKRYEVVSSPCEPALKLILLEGTWESLPFEIRLWRPWRGAILCADSALTSMQREEIAQRGYSIGHAVVGELIRNQSGASIARAGSTRPVTPIADVGSTRPMPPIEVQGLASDSDRAFLKRMRRSIQELAKTIEQSMGLIAETQFALVASTG